MCIESLLHTRRRIGVLVLLLIATAHLSVSAAPAFHPAKYRGGALPPLPPLTVVGGGEVMLELEVTSMGAVRAARALRTTAPYTDLLIGATKTWQFSPAELEIEPPPPP